MATYSTLTIIKKALVLCGASTVSSLTEDTPNARALNIVYELTRKSMFTECMWTFTVTRSSLVTVASTTIAWYHDEETTVYSRPTDALKIWGLSDSAVSWREEGDYILADSVGIGAKYTFDQSDESKWPPEFVVAFIDKLCSDICFMILNSPTQAKAFLEKYEMVSLPKAQAANSQIGNYSQVDDDYWISAKHSNGGNQAKSYA